MATCSESAFFRGDIALYFACLCGQLHGFCNQCFRVLDELPQLVNEPFLSTPVFSFRRHMSLPWGECGW